MGKGKHRLFIEQAAAIPFRRTPTGLRILLITSRSTGEWSVPKGMIEPGATAPETAAREAWEEAGVVGGVTGECVGVYEYRKRGVPHRVRVYALEVREQRRSFPESGLRKQQWLDAQVAIDTLGLPGLRAIVGAFAVRMP